jgi:cytochrome b561
MRWRLERTLFWITVGLVSIALLLAVAGEESSSPTVRTKILQWHEWIGLLSLPSLAAALTARWFDRHHHLLALPHWLPWLRRGLEISLYILLLLQPLSGWLLASDQGKLTSIFSWTLPPLAPPNGHLVDYGYVYHGVGGVLILLIAAISLRVNLTALVTSWAHSARRHRRPRSDARKRERGGGI